MPPSDTVMIERIRDASRRLVRELGFMGSTLAGTALSPSAVHAIIEIGSLRSANARDLAKALRLEKSTVSRLLRSLIKAGYLSEERDGGDTRLKRLDLTDKGQRTLAAISTHANRQVRVAISTLPAKTVADVANGLEIYATALRNAAAARPDPATDPPVAITAGYRPGVIGETVAMHAAYYSRTVGFCAPFESKVASEMAGFVARLGNQRNALWTATKNGRTVGAIAIDGEDLGWPIAHLRWFIVSDGLQGGGIGRRLIDAALQFVDRTGFAETRLWTFSGLDAARQLYERNGFELIEEKPGRQWGKEVREQQFLRVNR